MARSGGTGRSSDDGNGAGVLGAAIGGNVLGGGSMNAAGGMIFKSECDENSTSFFCRAMKLFTFAQGALYVILALLFLYFVMTFLMNGGFSKIGSLARSAAIVPKNRAAKKN